MHSDRELLELAAKARGGIEVDEDFGLIDPEKYTATQAWNPLTDDGDALRLAVKLGLTISVTGMFAHADCCNRDNDIGYFEENSARNDGCILKAARRAIVRAAAAIGEAMQ